MVNPLLSNFELAGQQIEIRDSASYATATAAQQAATTAEATATAAQQAATTAEATATAAQQAAEGIIAGFNKQFAQKPGEYVSPFFCLRNKTVYVEFPNLNTEKDIPASVWVTVCYIKTENLPLSTVYRDIIIGGVSVIVELNTNGQMKMYSQKKIPAQTPMLGGFSYLTI